MLHKLVPEGFHTSRPGTNAVAWCLTFSLLFVGLVYGAESYDQLFDRAKELAAQGQRREAIDYFEKAATADPNQMAPLINMGILYGQLRQFEAATQALRKAQDRFPTDPWPYYYLAGLQSGEEGKEEIGATLRLYNKAKALGLNEADDPIHLADFLSQFREKELVVEYHSLYTPQSARVTVRGNPIGNEELCRDILTQIEKMEIVNGRQQTIKDAQVELIRLKENGEIAEEKWSVSGPQGSGDYLVTTDSTPPSGFPAKIQIEISDYKGDL